MEASRQTYHPHVIKLIQISLGFPEKIHSSARELNGIDHTANRTETKDPPMNAFPETGERLAMHFWPSVSQIKSSKISTSLVTESRSSR